MLERGDKVGVVIERRRNRESREGEMGEGKRRNTWRSGTIRKVGEKVREWGWTGVREGIHRRTETGQERGTESEETQGENRTPYPSPPKKCQRKRILMMLVKDGKTGFIQNHPPIGVGTTTVGFTVWERDRAQL